jgi:Cof subfamily protein (haloacid dehalogenase superfamily)
MIDGGEPQNATNKLIAIDLDGTLVAPDNTISAENIEAIERAIRQGATVAIVTGRPYVAADTVARRLGLPSVPLVAFNGAVIRQPNNGEMLRSFCVPADLAEEVVEQCVQDGVHLHYYLADVLYVTADNEWSRAYCERNEMTCEVVPDMSRFVGSEPVKLLGADAPERIDELLERYRRRWHGRLYVTRSMPEYVEFMPPQVSKGIALDWLIDFYGIDREDTMAIGDSMNDVPMLERAGHPVAMPDGVEELKQLAEFVPPEQPTGVAAAIDWFLGFR